MYIKCFFKSDKQLSRNQTTTKKLWVNTCLSVYTRIWFTCVFRDLRGNNLICDCKLKWLVEWMHHTNATLDEIYCSGPLIYQGKRLNDLLPHSFDCITSGVVARQLCHIVLLSVCHEVCVFDWNCCFAEFASYQSLKFESISVEAFTFGMDQFVVFAQPFAGTCNFLEWDHVEMTFRTYDTIESEYTWAAWMCRTVLVSCFDPLSHSSSLNTKLTERDMRRSLLSFFLQAHPLLSASPWWSTTTSSSSWPNSLGVHTFINVMFLPTSSSRSRTSISWRFANPTTSRRSPSMESLTLSLLTAPRSVTLAWLSHQKVLDTLLVWWATRCHFLWYKNKGDILGFMHCQLAPPHLCSHRF